MGEYSQLPEDIENLSNNYTPSDNIVISNDTETTNTGYWVKAKEIALRTVIYPGSRFRFKFDMKRASGISNVKARIKRNGEWVGIERTCTSSDYQTYSEDIDTGNWAVGDTIELWCTAWELNTCYIRNFRLCGYPSQFENTQTEVE